MEIVICSAAALVMVQVFMIIFEESKRQGLTNPEKYV